MLKRLSVLLLLAFCLSLSSFANNVSEIDISVVIENDGDAKVRQTWQGSFDDGTENYILIGNLNGIEIKDFSVSDENGEFAFINNWDIDASRSKKKNKCGIIARDDGGFELCWGIGEYGDRTYYIEYLLCDFVASYKDADGSNFMFVNPEMSTFPTDVEFEMSLEGGESINDSNANIWAFGFDGEISFENGKIFAHTYSPLKDDNYFVVMFSLDKGIVNPSRAYDYSFEEVKDRAFEGSSYSDEDDLVAIIMCIIFVAVCLIIVVVALVHTAIISAERKRFYKEAEYFRGVPNHKNLPLSYYLAQKFSIGGTEGAIIGASIMKMIDDGNIICETDDKVGAFGKIKEKCSLVLKSGPDDPILAQLYDIFVSASGDGVLEEKELERYSAKHYTELRKFIDKVKENGESAFCTLGGFSDGISNRIKSLTDAGKAELGELCGFKKYLDEFTLIDERDVAQVDIWQEYLVYATLFGIADRVIEQLKKIYPDYIEQIDDYSRRVSTVRVYHLSMYRSMIAAEQKARSAGSGGRASFGGGGGFSGGGVGGGSR